MPTAHRHQLQPLIRTYAKSADVELWTKSLLIPFLYNNITSKCVFNYTANTKQCELPASQVEISPHFHEDVIRTADTIGRMGSMVWHMEMRSKGVNEGASVDLDHRPDGLNRPFRNLGKRWQN